MTDDAAHNNGEDASSFITLADGTRISTATGRPLGRPQSEFVPTHSEAVQELTRVRKRLADLPVAPKNMHPIALVVAYYLFGLEDFEIAIATGLTENQISNMRMTEAFQSMHDTLIRNLLEAQTNSVRDYIDRHAHNAAERMIELMRSESEQVSLTASKDVLDRSGHRPVDVVEHKHTVEGGLRIEYVRRASYEDLPTIDGIIVPEEDNGTDD